MLCTGRTTGWPEWSTISFQRYHGKKSVRYLVPEMKEILSSTYGIIGYQEQIMAVGPETRGIHLAEADLMRRAMGKRSARRGRPPGKICERAIERGLRARKRKRFFFDGAVFGLWIQPQS